MKRLVSYTLTLLLLTSCTTNPKLIVRNGTDSNIDIYLTAYTKRFSSNYTIIPNKKMTIGEYKNNAYEYTTTPYMFIRTKIVTDSIIHLNGKESGRLTVTEQDTIKVEKAIIDSLYNNELYNNSKKKPKNIILSISDSLFEKETIRNINGIRLKSRRFISQEAIQK
ncbi:MAG: hypothetical protein LBR46_00950 [Prevotella sp.]|nr:hypothetical protein [Prevotella sp.]